jgi:hypothetical protein
MARDRDADPQLVAEARGGVTLAPRLDDRQASFEVDEAVELRLAASLR